MKDRAVANDSILAMVKSRLHDNRDHRSSGYAER